MFKDKAIEIMLIYRELTAEGLKNGDNGRGKYYINYHEEGIACCPIKRIIEATPECGVIQVSEEDKYLVLTYSNGKIAYTSI